MVKRIISTPNAPAAVGAYSQGVDANGFVFVSGQLGLSPETGEFVSDNVEVQTEQALNNIQAILSAAGLGLENVVKTTILLADINDFKAVNKIYGSRFPSGPPARAAYAVATLPLHARVEIEAIAAK